MKSAKQKLSFVVASVFPMLALGAYFLLAPVQAHAFSSCSQTVQYAPCGTGSLNCQSGAGACYQNGSSNGVYVFCQGYPGCTGFGVCNNGYVTCE